jgi:hypothetical protein
LPQSIKSKSTSASPAEVDNQEVLLRHDQSVAKLTAFRVSAWQGRQRSVQGVASKGGRAPRIYRSPFPF